MILDIALLIAAIYFFGVVKTAAGVAIGYLAGRYFGIFD